jgi:hypothetical protein
MFFHNCPIFIHEDLFKPFILEMNVFNFASSAVLSQIMENDVIHPINLYFHFFHTKIKYEIHDKTFLTIVNVFEGWHHLLARVQYEIIIYFEQNKIIVFDDHSCFESTSSSIGIVLISILVCHHILF